MILQNVHINTYTYWQNIQCRKKCNSFKASVHWHQSTICTYWGVVSNDSFVTIIGIHMAFRKPVFASSFSTLLTATLVFWEINSVCNFHSRVQPCSADECIFLLNTSAIWTGSYCRPAESGMVISTYCCTWCWAKCISGVSLLPAMMCGTFPHP